MANVTAVKSGNWSDPTVWNTGSLPTANDVVRPSTYLVNIDVSVTVDSIRNDLVVNLDSSSADAIFYGGRFEVTTDGVTINCTNGIVGRSQRYYTGNKDCITVNLGPGQICTINSDIYCQNGVHAGNGVVNTGFGDVVIVGDLYSNTDSWPGGNCVISSSAGIVDITASFIARTGGAGNGAMVHNTGAGTVNILSSVIGGVNNYNFSMVGNSGEGTINITGNILGNTTTSTSPQAVIRASAGYVNVIGTLQASLTPCISVTNTGRANIEGTIIASAQPGVVSTSYNTSIFTGPFECSTNSVQAVAAYNWKLNTSLANTYLEVQTNDLAVKRTLYTAGTLDGIPDPYDVRLGVEYGPNNDLTGTCIIPPPAAVQAAVPVDDTFGTGEFASSPEGFWNKPLSELETTTSEGSVGRRMAKLPTAQLIAEYLAAYERV